jgi:hypothetical protein
VTARAPNGRFLPKLGAKLKPGDPGVFVLIPPRKDPADPNGVQISSEGLSVLLDPAVIVAAMREAHMAHTRAAIEEGKRPDGKGPQRPLGTRAAADPERKSDVRNFRTGELAEGLRVSPIKSDGVTASSTLMPPVSRTAHVAREKARGVVLLTTEGAAGRACRAAAQDAVAAMVTGRKVLIDTGEKESGDV